MEPCFIPKGDADDQKVLDVPHVYYGSSGANHFATHWEQNPLELKRGIDFTDRLDSMQAMFTHLQHVRPGKNTIKQSSVNSSVTIPYELTFRDQSQRSGEPRSKEAAPFDFCGCGWPQHMLLPKGTLMEYPVVLFCMVSNYATDKVEQDLAGSCNDAASYCGIRDRRYPDRRAMGYPFDRRARSGVNQLNDFLTPNMAVKNCLIKFTDVTTQRRQTQYTGA